MNRRDQLTSEVSKRLRQELNAPNTTIQRRREIFKEWQQWLNKQRTCKEK